MNNTISDDELEKIQDELTEQALFEERQSPLVVDNRKSIQNIREIILKNKTDKKTDDKEK